jgi:hypothetical protein
MERYVYIIGAVALGAMAVVWWWRSPLGPPNQLRSKGARSSARRVQYGLAVMALLILFAVLFTGGPKNPPM